MARQYSLQQNTATPKRNKIKENLRNWILEYFLDIPKNVLDAARSAASKAGKSLIGLVKKVGLAVDIGSLSSRSDDFVAPEFDLQQIQNAYQADGYIRTAVDKYVDLIFKAGYTIAGKNPKATQYIQARLAYMEEATGTPQDVLFSEIAQGLVMFNNVIIAKARSDDPNVFPPGYKIRGLDDQKPIAGYFPLNITTIKVKRDKNGTVKGWRQEVEWQDKPVTFKPQDIIHIYYKREPGKAFAYPSILAVIDDVRALREVEERTLHMLYRNIHPLFHVKIGSKEIPGTQDEVDATKNEIQNMSVEGGLVTTERVEIKEVSSNKVIDAEKYLLYFEKRVFTGLGVSETMMGRSDSSNRSTSDNQKEEAIDRVKAYQKIISVFLTNTMINELLREGGFDPMNNPEDRVEFKFIDPDADSKIKQDAHAVFLYQNNAITENELRQMLGRDPISDKERPFLWYHQYKSNSAGTNQASNTIQPENQHGKKTSPKKETNSFKPLLMQYMNDLRECLMKNAECLYIEVPNRATHIQNTIRDTQRLVVYWQNIVSRMVEEFYGQEQLNEINTGINQVFRNIYNTTVDIMSQFNTEDAIIETISAVFDVFIEELMLLVKNLREEETTSAK